MPHHATFIPLSSRSTYSINSCGWQKRSYGLMSSRSYRFKLQRLLVQPKVCRPSATIMVGTCTHSYQHLPLKLLVVISPEKVASPQSLPAHGHSTQLQPLRRNIATCLVKQHRSEKTSPQVGVGQLHNMFIRNVSSAGKATTIE
eukprot:gb/GFBE01013547.1/.p1 GENE.gb/GFBE01013547.1/~~gb/GFBE01013547.1/.p1  ORF type:complete len:144 (+),score=10.19 gb/GFBE01013547.1/:1-432(+)